MNLLRCHELPILPCVFRSVCFLTLHWLQAAVPASGVPEARGPVDLDRTQRGKPGILPKFPTRI